jgi:hypothetical protein
MRQTASAVNATGDVAGSLEIKKAAIAGGFRFAAAVDQSAA